MRDVEKANRLRETLTAYVLAQQAATTAYLGYQRLEVSEARVRRLQAIEVAAMEAHLAAIGAVASTAGAAT